jgi:hypothetical protein
MFGGDSDDDDRGRAGANARASDNASDNDNDSDSDSDSDNMATRLNAAQSEQDRLDDHMNRARERLRQIQQMEASGIPPAVVARSIPSSAVPSSVPELPTYIKTDACGNPIHGYTYVGVGVNVGAGANANVSARAHTRHPSDVFEAVERDADAQPKQTTPPMGSVRGDEFDATDALDIISARIRQLRGE